MRKKQIFGAIDDLKIFPTPLIEIIFGYYNQYNTAPWRELWAALSQISTGWSGNSTGGSFFFTSTEIHLFVIYTLAMDALKKDKDLDCKKWEEELKSISRVPYKALNSDPLYMLQMVLTGNYFFPDESAEYITNLNTHIRKRTENDSTKRNDWEKLQNIVRASISLAFTTAKINPKFIEFIFTENKKKGYTLPKEWDLEKKKIITDKALHYYLEPKEKSKQFLPRTRCVDFFGNNGYILALTEDEFNTLEDNCNSLCKNQTIFNTLKNNISNILNNFLLSLPDTEEAQPTKNAINHLISSTQNYEWSAIRALSMSCSTNPVLQAYHFNAAMKQIKILIETMKDQLPTIETATYTL